MCCRALELILASSHMLPSVYQVQVTDEDREREDDGLHGSKKIAAFDFDGCLVNTWVKRIHILHHNWNFTTFQLQDPCFNKSSHPPTVSPKLRISKKMKMRKETKCSLR
ncbi:hypothetical protein Dsin_001853 [Dipteronia sinensis]|uniref:Uncharacterized protein n=1 Tax=Dipteronia sinensis TaxID=43782 RepID=A0AAE0EJD8_9ROSI|nr:hypothetical protein Dsin_001853 [Dipteronia sinensis]